MRVRVALGVLVALTFADGAAAAPRARVIHVDARATGAETGASWSDAYPSLQSALAVAAPGDEIWVAEGTYRPTAGSDRAASFALVDGVAVLGGFAGTDTDSRSRDPWARPAILSGNIGNQDAEDDDSLHVVTADAAVGSGTWLDGFVIERGNAIDAAPLGGGGIYVAGSPRFTRCTLRENHAASGGAVYVDLGSPVFESCSFTGNTAATGGAVYTRGGATSLINAELAANTAERGAAVLVESGSLELINATVSRNAAEQGGGALWADGGAVLVHNSIVWGNAPAGAPFGGFEPVVAFSDVEGAFPGAGNLAADPRFLDAERGDFRLAPGSPAIDAGANALVPPAVTTALGGGPRIVAGPALRGRAEARVDLGAREFDGEGTKTPGAGRGERSLLGPLGDADGDGVPDETDCRPLDPQAWAVPAPAWDLLANGRAPTALSWRAPTAPGGMNVLYDVLRSTGPSDFASALCIGSDQSGSFFNDSEPVSQAFYYLVRAKNACGGNLGTDSALNPRTGAACSGLGQPCASDAACSSGFCTDSFCCDARCAGTCEGCAEPGRAGSCAAVAAGTDPADECAADPVSTCGGTGSCSGARSCEMWAEGTVCTPPSCGGASQLIEADTCDGAGTCVDAGLAECAPYICDPASPSCLASCAAHGDCALGECCPPACVDTTADPTNCGGCGVACTNAHGSTSCATGLCSPVCDPLWDSCNTDPVDGCETSLATLTDCGACGQTCSLYGANESCSTGSCQLTSCQTNFSDCDGNTANGCEQYHMGYVNTRETATWMGAYPGEENCGFICPLNLAWTHFNSTQGHRGQWFHIQITEISSCPSFLGHRIVLEVPPGMNFDLYAHSWQGGPIANSNGGQGVDEVIEVRFLDVPLTWETIDYIVEVVPLSGGGDSCVPWTIHFYGHPDC